MDCGAHPFAPFLTELSTAVMLGLSHHCRLAVGGVDNLSRQFIDLKIKRNGIKGATLKGLHPRTCLSTLGPDFEASIPHFKLIIQMNTILGG